MRIVLTILMAFALAPIAHASDSPRLKFLLMFFEMNEAAFAYHRHCLSTGGAIDETFLKSRDLVFQELLQEALADNPTMSPNYVRAKTMERQYNLQYRLDWANKNDGCYSKNAFIAKEHYQKLSNLEQAEILQYIDQQTKGL